MKKKENKFKKVIASIALWVFGATQILQWVTYANSFNIEWIDMNVINNSSTNNWGWTNWWEVIKKLYKIEQMKASRSALSEFWGKLDQNTKYIIYNVNNDWALNIITFWTYWDFN